MSAISSALIKQLREKTGAGMMDCKKALEESGGDFEQAVDWLRKKGLSAAAKKAGRVAAEGLIAIAAEGNKAAVIELNSETDFVAKNETFQELAKKIAASALETKGELDALKQFSCKETGKTVEELVTEHIATIGENLGLRRADYVEVSEGIVASYIHSAVAPNMGKIGVLVGLESSGDKEKLAELGKQLAMHVAAAKPDSLDVEGLDPALVQREKDVLTEQARASGKPDNIIEKMIEGRIRKYYEEVVLVEQLFIIDGKTKVSQVVAEAEKAAGAPIKITGFVRFALGEGVEKEESNFAEEVAAAAGQ